MFLLVEHTTTHVAFGCIGWIDVGAFLTFLLIAVGGATTTCSFTATTFATARAVAATVFAAGATTSTAAALRLGVLLFSTHTAGQSCTIVYCST